MPDMESKEEATNTSQALAKFWLDEISKAGKREADWRKEAKEVLERYRNEKRKNRGFNILWSNIELLKPAVLSRTPRPDVRRRFLQEDPVAHAGAQLLEKALAFTADDPRYGFTETLESARDDMLLPGRGVVRVIYERDIEKLELHAGEEVLEVAEPGAVIDVGGVAQFAQGGEPLSTRQFFATDDGAEVEPDEFDEEGNAFREEIARQEVYCKYVYWEDYREGDARCWEDVPWIAYRHTPTRKQLKELFGREKGMLVPLIAKKKEGGDKDSTGEPESPLDQAIVWEIWDRDKRERVWVAEGFHDDVLDVEPDPLKLENFYPQPAPLYAVTSTATRIPVPEFRHYKDQADELNEVTKRLTLLIKALKVRGAYAGSNKDLANILNGDENELFPIEDWAAMQDMGGLEKTIAWLPLETIAGVITSLYRQRTELKAEIFELTGLSDIVRGSSDPRETLGAQNIKASFGNVRLGPRQKPMERFVRSIFQIEAEIIAEHFTAEHLLAMTGMDEEFGGAPEQQPVPVDPTQAQQPGAPDPAQPEQPRVTMDQVMALLRDDKTRKFSIDVETDSTIAPDEQKEQATVVEFLGASTQFITAAGNAAQTAPQMVPMFLEMFKSAARRFKMGRELEDVIDDSIGSVMEAMQQAQNQPQVDPEMEKAKAELELKQADFHADQQRKQAEFQANQERLNAELRAELQRLQQELEAKLAMKAQEIQAVAALKAQQTEATIAIDAGKAQHSAALDTHKAMRDEARESIQAGVA